MRDRREYMRAWQAANPDKIKGYQERYRERHATKERPTAAQARLLRAVLLEKLGGKCVVCGWDDYRALQIDHVNGGGNKEAKATGRGLTYLLKLLSDPAFLEKYQLLCANHNWIKKYENNEVRAK